MSIYSLDTLSRDGAKRFCVEVLVVFAGVTLVYFLVVEPLLQSVAPSVYVQPGLDYSRYDFPDTASEITHLFLTVGIVGSFFYWRLNFTELGTRLKEDIMKHR